MSAFLWCGDIPLELLSVETGAPITPTTPSGTKPIQIPSSLLSPQKLAVVHELTASFFCCGVVGREKSSGASPAGERSTPGKEESSNPTPLSELTTAAPTATASDNEDDSLFALENDNENNTTEKGSN